MPKVRVRVEGSIDKALRQFKKKCIDAGVFKEIKRSSYYEKPSEERRRDALKREKNIRNAMLGKKKKKRLKPEDKPGGERGGGMGGGPRSGPSDRPRM